MIFRIFMTLLAIAIVILFVLVMRGLSGLPPLP